MKNIEDAKRMSKLLSEARYKTGVSQEYMAMELQVSKNTISAYEKGTSMPNMKQFLDWYRALGLNPTSYVLRFLNPEYENSPETDEEVDGALRILFNSLTPHQKKCVLHLLSGDFQGDPYAMINLFVAHSHLPINYRFSVANNICETYKLCESVNALKDIDKVMPNIEVLEEAIKKGREAAINGRDGY